MKWTAFLSLMLLGLASFAAAADPATDAYYRGVNQEKAKNYQAAIPEFQAALQANPKFYWAEKELGNCYYYAGDKAQAVQHYDAYLASAPQDGAVRKFADSIRGSAGSVPAPSNGGDGSKQYYADVYFNPVGFVFGLANVGFESSMGKTQSWKVAVDYASSGTATNKFTIFGAAGSWDFYFDPAHQLQGWFVGPQVQILSLTWNYQYAKVDTTTWPYTYTITDATASGLFYGGGVEGGYQWIFGPGFVLTPVVSLGFTTGSVSGVAGAPTLAFGGFLPGGGLNLGWAF